MYTILNHVTDDLVDWDPWQPAATAMDAGEDDGPHCDDPDFNVRQHTVLSYIDSHSNQTPEGQPPLYNDYNVVPQGRQL